MQRVETAEWIKTLRLTAKKAALCCGLFVVLISAAHAQNGRWYPEDEPAPVLKLKTVNDEEIDLASLKGRMVIVNFWATWCGPCIAEMPSLQALAARLGEKNVALIGVNFRESPQKIRDFQARYKVPFPLLRDAWQEPPPPGRWRYCRPPLSLTRTAPCATAWSAKWTGRPGRWLIG